MFVRGLNNDTKEPEGHFNFMIRLEEIPQKCKTDHLLLLVGNNALPNFVAANLLSHDQTTVHILHTDNTGRVAKALDGAIAQRRPEVQTFFWQIDVADSVEITEQVGSVLRSIKRDESIGMNYTGGTKAMSVHGYLAATAHRNDVVFSYLDAQTLSLRIDGGVAEQSIRIDARDLCPVDLDTLVRIHGYSGFKKVLVQESNVERSKIIDALLKIHLDVDGFQQWERYLTFEKELTALPSLDTYPELAPFVACVREHCGAKATTSDLAKLLGEKEQLVSYRKWLNAEWLEEYTLGVVQAIAAEITIDDWGMGLEPISGRRKGAQPLFELDVAAMRGYQLYAISCMASTRKDACQEHFFESYIRSRQLGGDEARAALVCFSDKPHQLETKIQESWLTSGDVRVFGREHLSDLQKHLRQWFETPNK